MIRSILLPGLLAMLLLAGCTSQDRPAKPGTGGKPAATPRTIVCYGNSLTEGPGLKREEAYPALLQEELTRNGLGHWTVVNGGVSGRTTAQGLDAIDEVLDGQVDVLVLELGANDGLRQQSVAKMRENLAAMVDQVRQHHPQASIVLCGMMLPDDIGTEAYRSEFKAAFEAVAQEKRLYYLPFLLDGVAGKKELNQPDGLHPNAEGHKLVARNVWRALQAVVAKVQPTG